MKHLKVSIMRKLLKFYPAVVENYSTTVHLGSQRSTVDEGEIHRLSKMANNWWKENDEMKALHSLNNLRIKLIVNGLVNEGKIKNEIYAGPEPLQGVNILEVGCGGGILTEPLARLGANVTGLDASEELISVAQLHADKDRSLTGRLTYVHGTIEEHGCNNSEAYDAVVASEVVEHVTEKKLFLKSSVMSLKPGGSFFATTLNKTFISWFGAIVAAQMVLKVVPEDTHEWEKFISPQEMEYILESSFRWLLYETYSWNVLQYFNQ